MIVSPRNNTKQSIILSLAPPAPLAPPTHQHQAHHTLPPSPDQAMSNKIFKSFLVKPKIYSTAVTLRTLRLSVHSLELKSFHDEWITLQGGWILGSRSMGPQTIQSRSQLQIKHLVTSHNFPIIEWNQLDTAK